MQARVLVVDDDPRVTAFLQRGLAYEGFAVAAANDGQQALAIARETPPDLVVLDIMMPGLDGLELLRRLRTGGDPAVILLTAKDAVTDRVRGLEAGADDYLVKPFAFEELLARIRAVLRRRQPASREVLRYEDLEVDLAARTVRRGGRLIALSTTEFNLLALLAQHPNRVLPRALIMDRVWGYDFGGASNVLEVYVRYLRNKLEAAGEPRLVQTVRGVGYVLRKEPP